MPGCCVGNPPPSRLSGGIYIHSNHRSSSPPVAIENGLPDRSSGTMGLGITAVYIRRTISPREPKPCGGCPFSPTTRKRRPSVAMPVVQSPVAQGNRTTQRPPGVRDPPGMTLPTHSTLQRFQGDTIGGTMEEVRTPR